MYCDIGNGRRRDGRNRGKLGDRETTGELFLIAFLEVCDIFVFGLSILVEDNVDILVELDIGRKFSFLFFLKCKSLFCED